jgi:hypothetical protein
VKTITEPGWYRLTRAGWERVAEPETRVEDIPDGGWDLVLVTFEAEEAQLW